MAVLLQRRVARQVANGLHCSKKERLENMGTQNHALTTPLHDHTIDTSMSALKQVRHVFDHPLFEGRTPHEPTLLSTTLFRSAYRTRCFICSTAGSVAWKERIS